MNVIRFWASVAYNPSPMVAVTAEKKSAELGTDEDMLHIGTLIATRGYSV
jgi:hypothetical protein